MISGLIPHRYAKALYKYGKETGADEELYDCMKTVIAAYRSTPELQKTMSNPYVDKSEKKRLLATIAGKGADDAYNRFVSLVLDHDREEFFELMAYAFRDIYRKANNISQVRITSAVEMADDELGRIREVVEKSYPESKFEYDTVVNPDLIGGFIIDVDSTRLDASISGELEQLRQNLLTGN